MDKLYLFIIVFLLTKNSFPQIPILFYDFENNNSRNTFENAVEQSINGGSGPLVRVGSGVVGSGYGDNGRGRGIWGYNWQNVTSDPGANATEYYQFSINSKGFKGLTIRFRDLAPYSYSPGSVGCCFSANGTTYKAAGSNSTSAPSSNWSDGIILLYNFPEVNNNSNLIIRIYSYKGLSSSSTGLLALDNIVITADTIISGAGDVTLINERDFYNSYYSGGSGDQSYSWKKNLVLNGPGTSITLVSPINFSQKFIVNDGSSVQLGEYPIWGNCSFSLNKGGTIYCGDGGGISAGSDSSGNICVKGTRSYSPGANYYYCGVSAQITGNGLPTTVNTLGINNYEGVSLTNSVIVADSMKLLTGNLLLNNNNLTLNDTAVIIGGSATSYVVADSSGGMVFNKMMQNANIKFPVGTSNFYNPVIINYTGISDTFKVKVKKAIALSLTNPDDIVNCLWNITENTAGGSNATVKLEWTSSQDAPGFNINSDVMMGIWDGTSWHQTKAVISGSGTSEDPYIASAEGVTNFSSFGLGNEGSLPIELNYFGYTINGRKLILNWETATEKNSDKFEIERLEPNKNDWESLGNIKASFISNSVKYYTFIESDLEPGKFYYRLKMIDNNGMFQLSKIVEVDIQLPSRFELLQNHPNPFNPATLINYSLPEDAQILIEIYNINGEKVLCLVNGAKKAGFYEVDFNPSREGVNIPSGIYFYKMDVIDSKNKSRISQVKKMIYLK